MQDNKDYNSPAQDNKVFDSAAHRVARNVVEPWSESSRASDLFKKRKRQQDEGLDLLESATEAH
eukprot:111242-Alexandrium_andersonii.AAC.1